VLGKLAALDAVDRELRAIERVLDERRDILELREPGVAACPRCGALHGSDARFCPQCGTQFSGPLAMVEVGDAPTRQTPEAAAPTTQHPPAVSATALGATPVSGALEGNPPPAPPPAPAPAEATAEGTPHLPGQAGGETLSSNPAAAPAPEQTGANGVEHAAEQPTTVQPAAPLDQPTQAFPAAGGEHAGNGDRTSAVTSGDPLAGRERPDA
jgi:ribosomal protein L40E